jgi:hypothetical protein
MLDLRSLDIILEDSPPDGNHPFVSAHQLVEQLRDARQNVLDLEHKLGTIKHRMSADLALSIRRAQPGLSVALDKNGCKVGYKTKVLQFLPDIESGIWKAISPNRRFLREFLNQHRRSTLMTPDMTQLVTAIVSYFAAYYRTLQEDIVGNGHLMIDDKRGTLVELIEWRDSHSHPLVKSRLRGITNG